MTTVIYVLMMLAIGTSGWQIVPIKGNHYTSFADCTVIRNSLLRNKVFKWGSVRVYRFRCVPQRVEKLQLQKRETLNK